MVKDQLHEAFRQSLERAGNNQSRYATAIGTSQQLVSYWLKRGKPLPGEYVLPAEAAGLGSRYELRPDLYPLEQAPEPTTIEATDTASPGESEENCPSDRKVA